MWIWYAKWQTLEGQAWRVTCFSVPMEQPCVPCSFSCMMIPGTYAEMRADYD